MPRRLKSRSPSLTPGTAEASEPLCLTGSSAGHGRRAFVGSARKCLARIPERSRCSPTWGNRSVRSIMGLSRWLSNCPLCPASVSVCGARYTRARWDPRTGPDDERPTRLGRTARLTATNGPLDCVDDVRPYVPGEVVAHAVDDHQLGIRDRGSGRIPAAHVDEQIVRSVDHQSGDPELAQAGGSTRGCGDRSRLTQDAPRVIAAIKRMPRTPGQPLLWSSNPARMIYGGVWQSMPPNEISTRCAESNPSAAINAGTSAAMFAIDYGSSESGPSLPWSTSSPK